MGNAPRLSQDFHKQAAAAQIITEVIVDQVTIFSNQADSGCPYPKDARLLLQVQEDFQQGKGLMGKDLVVGDLDKTVADPETFIDGFQLDG